MQADAVYASTLASLEPEVPLNVSLKRSRLSLRYQGSMLQNLRKPSKMPDVHRPYHVGDPPQRIDWRAYARTDQLLLREVHEEAAARVLIMVDGSPSMYWPDADVRAKLPWQATTKWEVAARIAFHLSFTHVRAGDLVSLVFFDGSASTRLMLRHQTDVLTYFHWLKQEGFSKQALAEVLRLSDLSFVDWQAYDRRILVSDMLDAKASFEGETALAPTILLHCLSPFELNADWFREDVNYFEQGVVSVELPGKYLTEQQRYQLAIDQWRGDLEAKFNQNGGGYLCVTEQTRITDFHQFLTHAIEG